MADPRAGRMARYAYDADGNIISVKTSPAPSQSPPPPSAATKLTSPQISGVTPEVVNPGDSLTISGSGFDPRTEGDDVAMGQELATVLSATPNRLRVSIPTGPSFSGALTVATPGGSTSGPDVFAAPPSYTAAQVGFTARLRDGGATTVNLPQPGRIGLLTIDAAASQRLSIVVANSTIASGFITVLSPGGAGIPTDGATQFVSGSASGFVGPTTLPGRGTYTVVVSPASADSGKVTLTPNLFLDQHGAITPNGPAVRSHITSPGQRSLFSFEPAAGKLVSVHLTGGTFSAPCGGSLSILSPDGTSLAHAAGCLGDDFVDATKIPASGTYTVVVAPADTDTGTATERLYQFSDQTGSIVPNGPAKTSNIKFPGQRSLFSFSGTAGQKVSVGVAAANFPTPCAGNLYLLRADGAVLTKAGGCLGPGDSIPPFTLPKSARYTVDVDPGGPDTGTAKVRLTVAAGSAAHPIAPRWNEPRGDGWGSGSGGGSQASLAGRVLQVTGSPLAGVTLSVGKKTTRTDAAGDFVLKGLTGGHHVLTIDGATAMPHGSWGIFVDGVDLASGKTTRLPYTIWMTRLDTRHAVTIDSPTRGRTVVSNPAIPGLQLVLAPGTVIRNRAGRLVRRLTLTPISVQKPPFPLPPFIQLPTYFTIQPGDVTLSRGARLLYPKLVQAAAGRAS